MEMDRGYRERVNIISVSLLLYKQCSWNFNDSELYVHTENSQGECMHGFP